MVLDIEIHILGHEYSIGLPAGQQELAAHIKPNWWSANAAMAAREPGKDLRWHRLTHTTQNDHTTPRMIAALVPRFEPALEAHLRMPERFRAANKLWTVSGESYTLSNLSTEDLCQGIDSTLLYHRVHVDAIVPRTSAAQEHRSNKLIWDEGYDTLRHAPIGGHKNTGRATLLFIYPALQASGTDSSKAENPKIISPTEPNLLAEYPPGIKAISIAWANEIEFDEVRGGIPFHSLVSILECDSHPVISKAPIPKVNATPSEDPKPAPPPDATDGIYIKNRTDKIRDSNAKVVADNTFPSKRYRNATEMWNRHCATNARNMMRNIETYMAEIMDDKQRLTFFKHFSGWSYDEPRPRIKWADDVPQNTQVQQLVKSLGEVTRPSLYTRAPAPACSSESVTVALNGNFTIRRPPKPISLSAISIPKKRTRVVITLGESTQVEESTLDPWQTLSAVNIQYNSELRLYRFVASTETFTRHPGDEGPIDTTKAQEITDMLHLINTQFPVRFAKRQAAQPYIDDEFWKAHKKKNEKTEDSLRKWLTALIRYQSATKKMLQ
jgi:hypothetical protein